MNLYKVTLCEKENGWHCHKYFYINEGSLTMLHQCIEIHLKKLGYDTIPTIENVELIGTELPDTNQLIFIPYK